jgi:peroxiredoxin
MSFREKLTALKVEFGSALDVASSAEMQKAMMKLIEAEEQNRPLRVGDIAPAFRLRNTKNTLISSDELLERGPLVVTFYRGLWCPYCQKDLQAFEDTLAALRSANASVAAISHQLWSDNSRQFQQDNPMQFPVLEDETGDVAVHFGIRWAPDDLSFIGDTLGIPTTFRVSEPWIVPMQARYVIRQDGVIVFAEVAFDYSQRSDPTTVLAVLDSFRP